MFCRLTCVSRAFGPILSPMPTLLEQIETDGAAKLDIPAGTAPAQELGRFKDFLKVESHRLKQCHRMGDYSGLEICQARAGLMDVVISALWKGARATLSPQAQKEFPPMALVALGGYGRSELNPFSDLDIMILHDGLVVAGSRPLPSLSKLMDGILYPLWDLGFKVGHSVRTIAECVQVANKDMQSKTSLIESRLVIGDTRLFQKYQKTVLAKCVEGHEQEYIQARLEDQTTRHKKFGNSPTMQEPNIKNGCGGLRDYQNLHWMVYFKYRARTLAEMEERELMSTAERSQLESAYDFLLMARNELHHQVTRPVDVLSKNLQPKVAMQLGYTDRSPSKRLEQFMREFYTHSRNIYLITRTLEDRLALLPKPTLLPSFRQFIRVPFRTPPAEQVLDGFTFKEGKVFAVSNRVFRDQPRRLMRVFLYAQQRGCKLHPDLVQLMRNELHLVIRSFLQDEHVRETFLEILNQRGNVGPPLRAMHEVGLLGKYMPEFGRLTCLVQHEFYHQYTADEHTLVCLEELDRVWNSHEEKVAKYATLFQAVERPHLLYLALLLHDSGKAAHDGKHTEASSQLAGHAAKRLMLDGVTTHDLRLLIDHHLVMVQVSQRRDLSDPAVIRRFAGQVQTLENLRMLTLHTYADSIATSSKLWNDFKDSLLWELYVRTSQALEGGAVTIRAEEKQKELLAEEVIRSLPRNITQEELDAHFATLPCPLFPDPQQQGNTPGLNPCPPFHVSTVARWRQGSGTGHRLAQRAGPRLHDCEGLHMGPRRAVQQDCGFIQCHRHQHSHRARFYAHRRHRAGHILRD